MKNDVPNSVAKSRKHKILSRAAMQKTRKKQKRSQKKRTRWTQQEDQKLLQQLTSLDPSKGEKLNWSEVAQELPGRNGKQCRERWRNSLHPDRKKHEWTSEEDAAIEYYRSELGNRWTEIAHYFPDRTDNDIKNRYYSQKRAKERRETKYKAQSAQVRAQERQEAAPKAQQGQKAKKATKTLKNAEPKMEILPLGTLKASSLGINPTAAPLDGLEEQGIEQNHLVEPRRNLSIIYENTRNPMSALHHYSSFDDNELPPLYKEDIAIPPSNPYGMPTIPGLTPFATSANTSDGSFSFPTRAPTVPVPPTQHHPYQLQPRFEKSTRTQSFPSFHMFPSQSLTLPTDDSAAVFDTTSCFPDNAHSEDLKLAPLGSEAV